MMENRDTHPSYGLLGINRTQTTGARLFQSELNHRQYITLTIRRAERARDLHNDWIFGKEELIEVAMSEAQFAAAITSFGIGDGQPCTITYVKDEGRIEDPPQRATAQELHRAEFEQAFKRLESSLRTEAAEMQATLDTGKAPTKKQAAHLVTTALRMAEYLHSNLTFARDEFEHAMEGTVSHAKAEIEAYLAMALRSAGLASLANAAPQIRLLEEEGAPE